MGRNRASSRESGCFVFVGMELLRGLLQSCPFQDGISFLFVLGDDEAFRFADAVHHHGVNLSGGGLRSKILDVNALDREQFGSERSRIRFCALCFRGRRRGGFLWLGSRPTSLYG